ncbi:MAG: PEGA domain-containing protein [Acidobacteria bacterium]|nr:PEGA domain-containing protein [Acidobacteriota bacterium]
MRLKLFSVAVLSLLTLPLIAADADTKIRVRSTPRGAGLFVDGKYVGPAGRFSVPEKYVIEPGSHEITLKDPRYEDFSAKIDAKAGKTTKLSAKLKRKEEPKGPFGRLRLKGGEGESFWSVAAGDIGPIYLNGQFMGHVDELNDVGGGLLVPAGTYELKVQSQIYGEFTKTVTIEAGKVNRVVYGAKKEQ